jgi:hypothetical protein
MALFVTSYAVFTDIEKAIRLGSHGTPSVPWGFV